MSHPYAIPTTGPTGSPSAASPSTTNTTTRSPSITTQGPGSVNRKLVVDPVHGHTREETREERRTRKDRERQLRDSSTALPPPPIPSSSSSASSSRVNLQNAASTSTSSKSVLTIALQRAQSAVLLDSANNFPAAISAYSQSVRLLKEVMARVESKGVEMERKGSTGSVVSTMSGASSGTLTRRDNESNDEWEKRKSRWDKKEKAKADEARRLKVIHDTYEDRIKMLLAMNPSLASATSPSIAAAVLPASTSNSSRLGGGGGNESSSPASPTTASMRFHRRRSSTELPEMSPTSTQSRTHRSTPSSSSAHSLSGPTSPTALAGVGQAMLSSNLASPTSPSTLSSSSSNGIPRIAQLPIISPSNSLNNLSNLATSLSHDPSYLSHLNPSSTSNRPLSTASDSTAKALPLSGTVTPTAPSAPTSILPRPLPPPTTSLPPPPPPDHPPPPIPSTVVNRNSASSGSSQGEDQRIPVTALDYGEDWPREGEDGEGQREELRLPVVDRDPVGSSQLGEGTRGSPVSPPRHPPPVFPTHKTGSTPPRSFPLSSTNSSPMRRGSSASAVYTLQSHARPPTNSFSTYNNASNMAGGGGGGGGGEGSASMMMRRTMSSEGPNPSSILRPMRSASLASQGQVAGTGPQVYSSGMVPSLSAGSHHSTNSSFSIGNYARSITPAGTMTPVTNLAAVGGNEDGLVSQSTAGGTISQRRFAGGLTTGQGEGSTPTSSSGQQLEATIVVRAPSQESYRSSQAHVPSQGYDEFGSNVSSNRTSGIAGGGAFGSLPGRLRALSQPSQKRPKLPTNHSGSWIADSSTASNSPPVPPLLSQTPSSASSTSTAHRHHLPSLSISSTTNSGGALSRKPSVPTPTTLNAPPFPATLGRSNSSSSVGSSASGRYSDRSLPPPVPSSATTASNLSLHAQSTPSSNYGIPSPPNRSSASSRETVMSIPPVRRPFHLMRLVVATMPNPATSPNTSRSSVISLAPSASGGGGYLSEKLYVPSQIWSIPGSKLVAIETKVRMMEIVLSSLSQLSTSGQSLLSPALANTARNSGSGGERWCVDEATRFMRELESFEGVVEGVQNTLAKKLGGGLINPTGGGIGNSAFNDKEFGGFGTGGQGGKDAVGGGIGSGSGKDARKGSTAGGQFASWSSKFQRGFDRVTNANGVSLDSQATYVETVARLFRQSQSIDHHLALLLSTSSSSTSQNEVSAYSLLPLSERHRLERHLRRASEFFGTVVCRFVMKDVGLLLDKYVKRGGAWLSGE